MSLSRLISVGAAAAAVALLTAVPESSSGASSAALPQVSQNFKSDAKLTASAPGITPTTIRIGFVTEQTGPAASTFGGGNLGALARFDLQNAEGGIDGRKLVLVPVDDGTIGAKAADQELIENQNVFGIIDISSFAIEGAPYLQQLGVPVTGGAFDGPEWGQQPYTNMFSFLPPLDAPIGGKFYLYNTNDIFMKSIGITKLATLAYGISPSAVQTDVSTLQAGEALGIKGCYTNNSVQFGQSSFTTEALAIANSDCDGTFAALVDSSDVALAAALKQGGVSAKQFFETGYDQTVLNDPASLNALDNVYFPADWNYTDPSPGVAGMVAALHKYDKSLSGIPSGGLTGSYLGADLMIQGLEVAGANPTRASFISGLHKVATYDAHGALQPLGYNHFATVGMFPSKYCNAYVQLKGSKFVTSAKNVCGKLVATN